MTPIDPDARAAFITGLYQLADYLAENPGIPVPAHGTTILVPLDDQEDGTRQRSTMWPPSTCGPSTTRTAATRPTGYFGPVGYKITRSPSPQARHRAEYSYWGCVTPDEAGSDA